MHTEHSPSSSSLDIDIYSCVGCHYNTLRKSDYVKHCSTKKHIINTQLSHVYGTPPKIICDTCNRQYKDRSGLWRHKKKCNSETANQNTAPFIQPTKHPTSHIYCSDTAPAPIQAPVPTKKVDTQPISQPTDENISYNSLMFSLIKQNQELKDMLVEEKQVIKNMLSEQNAKIEELTNKQSIVINNNNNNSTHFNLNIFLNEKCKDAITIMDFVNSLQVNTSDVEYTGRYGYVEGITKIFIDGLKQLDIYKRPIHCTDLKRETLYIKEANSWEKDSTEKSRLKKALSTVVRKNVQQIAKWQDENPRCNILDSKEYVLHLSIMRQSLGGGDFEKTDRNNEKIIRNIAKEVLIDKKNS